MERAKSVCGDRKQNIIFLILLVVGGFLANTLIFAPLHEAGHQHFAMLQGIDAKVIDRNHTHIAELTPSILAAGYHAEVVVPLALAILFFLLSSPRDNNNGILELRKWYCHIGLFLGYATWSWLTPLFQYTEDFNMVPEWTKTMKDHWLFDPGLFLFSFLCIFFLSRLKSRSSSSTKAYGMMKST